ncbi:hypothetical protein D3C85_1551990 [compost metagenome]
MQVECALAGGGQQRFSQQVAIVEREQVIGVELTDALDPQRVVGIFRRMHRDAFFGTQLRNGTVKGVFFWIIGMRKHRGNLDAGREQGFNTGTANIVIREDNCFYAH